MSKPIPVIAIDGPTASGKGTVAALVAGQLGWHLLDSGSIYRLLALAALECHVPLEDEAGLMALAGDLNVRFEEEGAYLAGRNVTLDLRLEAIGNAASKLAVLPGVRQALMERQRAFRLAPGLVADGRDMGSVVFPDAPLKIFLTASVESRASRRHKQLIEKGLPANLDSLLHDLRERDARDTNRAVAPLKPCEDSILLDTTTLSIDEAVAFVLREAQTRQLSTPN
ncbi:(d)CMP kinase [Niveibacterium sp. SC-1]|uniref:(d)CMP kinase n=1 Tax=Niveibacterium sp. SC-1 TaxID=3135646 RepID=UPI00311F4EBA